MAKLPWRRCYWQGTQLKIRFDPPLLNHEPVLPFDEPMSVLVDAINDTDHDIEFYSLISIRNI